MSFSRGRSRRQNAGNKMRVMIEEERAKIESGDAALSEEDEDFARKDEVEDVVDSDFEETDSEAERAAEEASKVIEEMAEKIERRRQRKLARKQRIVPQFAGSRRKPTDTSSQKSAVRAHKKEKPQSVLPTAAEHRTKPLELAVRVSSRTSAVRKAQESEALEQEREELAAIKRRRKKSKHVADEPVLTQAQLLEEAKKTEIENLEKLKEFQSQEAEEKQRQRQLAARKDPLMIRPVAHWESRTVPDPSDGSARLETKYALAHLDDERYPLNPWVGSAAVMPPKICPVTGLPARYFHPRAKVPYSNARAYRILEDLVNGKHAYIYDADVWSSTDIV
ncbi:Vacuolar protein sorting-associated protein 72 [Coemansia sp. RSA 2702]|nr:Vacuolar protein sorting-associated protein 72 [Coemansia sp. RSA 2705]KAJ2323642.1 Vacuolar protein sorting-associated protein 72 [Coemansia sp. RSA 2702]KAJ2738959.1 Vacuolar protein sorting-associated protein 72 [Coemansia sp. Cherry 401B]